MKVTDYENLLSFDDSMSDILDQLATLEDKNPGYQNKGGIEVPKKENIQKESKKKKVESGMFGFLDELFGQDPQKVDFSKNKNKKISKGNKGNQNEPRRSLAKLDLIEEMKDNDILFDGMSPPGTPKLAKVKPYKVNEYFE